MTINKILCFLIKKENYIRHRGNHFLPPRTNSRSLLALGLRPRASKNLELVLGVRKMWFPTYDGNRHSFFCGHSLPILVIVDRRNVVLSFLTLQNGLTYPVNYNCERPFFNPGSESKIRVTFLPCKMDFLTLQITFRPRVKKRLSKFFFGGKF